MAQEREAESPTGADGESGWKGFSDAEKARRERARVPKNETQRKKQGWNSKASCEHFKIHRDAQQSEYEIQKDVSS